jgi:hypothetical protein
MTPFDRKGIDLVDIARSSVAVSGSPPGEGIASSILVSCSTWWCMVHMT